jgi:hypothetical protein
MKYTIEVEDFYLEGGDDGQEGLEKGLREYITHEVVRQIWKQIKEKVDDAITMKVKAKVEQEMALQINTRIREIISSETITRDKKEISISDYIKQQFENNSGWNNPNEQITKRAKEFGDEMKKRYDFFYANQIVQQMHTVGIIKEEIYANLIENKK